MGETFCGANLDRIEKKVINQYAIQLRAGAIPVYNYYYYDIGDIDGNNINKYFINIKGDVFVPTETIAFMPLIDHDADAVTGTGVTNSMSYYERDGSAWTKKILTYYTIQGNRYITKEQGGGGATSGNATVGLYLNNPSMKDDKAIGNGNQRLFVCCAQNGSAVSNLFAVTKDGTVSFGGTIKGETDATNLSDKITIDKAKMYINADGDLFISFD